MKELNRNLKVFAVAVLGLSSSVALAFRPVGTKPTIFQRSGIQTPNIGEQLHRTSTKLIKSDLADIVEVDAHNKIVRLLEGNIKGALAPASSSEKDLLSAVEDFVNKNPKIFGVSFEELSLNKEASVFKDGYQFLKFDVKIDGVKIKEAQIDFRFRDGKLFQVFNESYGEAKVLDASIDESSANEIASLVAQSSAKVTENKNFRVKKTKEGFSLIPVSKFTAETSEGEFNFEINMNDASVREITHKHFHANIVIKGFSKTYKEEPLHVYYEDGVLFGQNGRRYTAGREGSLDSGKYFFNELYGSAATIKSKDGKVALKRAEAISTQNSGAREFILNPWKNASEDDTWASYGTAYANISIIKDLILEANGGNALTPWMAKPTTVFVNHNNHCNAYWDGSSINFFQSSAKCANSGNLGEIVLHEWGHGLDDNLGGISDGAYSEGFGDLLAFSVYWNPNIGEGFFKSSNKPVRDISVFKSYPKDQGGVHQEGQIIGNTMFDLYMQMKQMYGESEARQKFRSYVYTMMASTSKYTDVANYLMSYEANESLRCLINNVFTKHGLANARPGCM